MPAPTGSRSARKRRTSSDPTDPSIEPLTDIKQFMCTRSIVVLIVPPSHRCILIRVTLLPQATSERASPQSLEA